MSGSRHPGRAPGPLDNLPRPLDERDRGGRRRRRLGTVVALAVVVAAGGAIVTTLTTGPMGPVGEVQGAVGTAVSTATPGPDVSRRPLTVPAARPTVAALPTPTPRVN